MTLQLQIRKKIKLVDLIWTSNSFRKKFWFSEKFKIKKILSFFYLFIYVLFFAYFIFYNIIFYFIFYNIYIIIYHMTLLHRILIYSWTFLKSWS